jgi:hypothetical protein
MMFAYSPCNCCTAFPIVERATRRPLHRTPGDPPRHNGVMFGSTSW